MKSKYKEVMSFNYWKKIIARLEFYSTNIPFKMNLSEKQKLRELITVIPSLKEIFLMELIRQENNPNRITELPEETKSNWKVNEN